MMAGARSVSRSVLAGSRSCSMPEGSCSMLEVSRSMLEGSRSMLEGSRSMLEGSLSMLKGSLSVQEWSRSVQEWSRSMLEGSRSVQDGWRFWLEGGWEATPVSVGRGALKTLDRPYFDVELTRSEAVTAYLYGWSRDSLSSRSTSSLILELLTMSLSLSL